MKIEILTWKFEAGKKPYIKVEELNETTFEEVADAYPFDESLGVIVDGKYGIAEFDIENYTFVGFRECSKEEAEKYAIA